MTHKRPLFFGSSAGEKWLYGCWFYRPNETFHLATRKFLEKEVFKSDYYNKAPVSKILGKCVVMFVKVRASLRPLRCTWRRIAFIVLSEYFTGVLQTSAGGLQSRGRLRVRVQIFGQVQIL